MFEADTFEKESGKVTIDNIRPEVFVEMLHFFYTGQLNCDITEENAIELLKEADKYLIDQLKTLCKEKLRQERRERDCPRGGALWECQIVGEEYIVPGLKYKKVPIF